MKKLLIGAALCTLFAAPALAAEPIKLSPTQMDSLTAGCDFSICTQFNVTKQWASATAVAVGGGHFSFTAASAEAENENETEQEQGTD